MKTLRRLVFALYAIFAAALPAHADIVWIPSPIGALADYWPVLALLVLLLIIVTICILHRNSKK